MMTNRPSANRSRWITGIAVCASAVGLAALLGAAMTPSPAGPTATRGKSPAPGIAATGAHAAPLFCEHEMDGVTLPLRIARQLATAPAGA